MSEMKKPIVKPHKLDFESSSESDETTSSSSLDGNNLSILAEFDEIVRGSNTVKQDRDEVLQSYIDFVKQTSNMKTQFESSVHECKRLRTVIEERTSIISDLESKLDNARRILDHERKKVCLIEDEKNFLVRRFVPNFS